MIFHEVKAPTQAERYIQGKESFTQLLKTAGPHLLAVHDEILPRMNQAGKEVWADFAMAIWPNIVKFGSDKINKNFYSHNTLPQENHDRFVRSVLALRLWNYEQEMLYAVGSYPAVSTVVMQDDSPRLVQVNCQDRIVILSPDRETHKRRWDACYYPRKYNELDKVFPCSKEYPNAVVIQPELWEQTGHTNEKLLELFRPVMLDLADQVFIKSYDNANSQIKIDLETNFPVCMVANKAWKKELVPVASFRQLINLFTGGINEPINIDQLLPTATGPVGG